MDKDYETPTYMVENGRKLENESNIRKNQEQSV